MICTAVLFIDSNVNVKDASYFLFTSMMLIYFHGRQIGSSASRNGGLLNMASM